ncbi:PH domain-containing protein [Aeromicrobium sp.]|uniref:PH domain-containing protein n=1 Tax=Aeromicrobium sp. TaxID=1871063 RepID=UPI003C565C8A
MSDLRTFRPGGTRAVAYGVAILMLVLTVVVGLSLPSDIAFTPAEDVTLWIIIGAVLALLHGIGRSFVRAGDDGVEVLNGYRRHRIAWGDIRGVAMNPGAPWPTLVTTDDDRIMLFGIQGSDGSSAQEAVDYLRGRLSA